MTKEEFVVQLERGVQQTAALPVTSRLLAWTVAQLKRSEPPWWKGIAKSWEKRRFVAWSEAWGLYVAALHFEALNDADCPLVRFFPSCGGTAEADPSPGLARFLANPPPTFFDNLARRRLRSYLAPRASLWVIPALLYFQRRGLPFYLVEAGSAGGLNLIGDMVLRSELTELRKFDSSLVAARIGLDDQLLDVTDIADRRWLTACLLPEGQTAIMQLDDSIDILMKQMRVEPNFIQMVKCAGDKAPAFVSKNIPTDDPDVGLLLFNSDLTSGMTYDEYVQYVYGVQAMLKPWGDRGLWVDAELVRAETFSSTIRLRAHRMVGHEFKSYIVAAYDLAGKQNRFDEGAKDFLDASPAKK